MDLSDRDVPPRPASARRVAALCLCLLACPRATAQVDETPPLRLGGVLPGGVRVSTTESWGAFDFSLTNLTDVDRQARVLVFYDGRPDLQYGRDVWVPARATLATWLLVGPASPQPSARAREIQMLLYERAGKEERLILPRGEERVRSRAVLYQKRAAFTAVLLDEEPPEEIVFGQLPQPDSANDEALRLVRTFRQAHELSESVQIVGAGPMPPAPEAFDGVDHFVLASGRVAHDPAGSQALRRWVERGGTLWVMLDRVEPDVIAPLLGDALDFQVVDRVSLTSFQVESQPPGPNVAEAPAQRHERPVDFVRVLLPAEERVRHTVDGWPAWFVRRVGRGKVVFTTLGPRGWYRPRTRTDPPSPFEFFPALPVSLPHLQVLSVELPPRPEEDSAPDEAFQTALTEEIGYAVVGRGTAGLIFGTFLLATLALGLILRRGRRPELLGWLGPAAALGAAGAFVALGEWSRRAVPPTVAAAQVVDAVAGTEEAPVHGLLALYRPDSGPADVGATKGGFFELDMTGLEEQNRRLIRTDLDSWHWENLSLPAGVRRAPYRFTAPTGEPLAAAARLGPEGVEGTLATGPFHDLEDALLHAPGVRDLSIRLGPDGAFRAGGGDVLPPGQFAAGAVLSDRQQRRQDLYRTFLRPSEVGRLDDRPVLLAWARPIDMPFALAPEARTVGMALLRIPLRLERPAPGTSVTIPAPFLPCRRLVRGGATRLTLESRQGADMRLRFQLPAAVLPLAVERARLTAKIDAPGRRVTVAVFADGVPAEIHRAESPFDPVRVDIADARLLLPDEGGGLHVNLTVGGAREGGGTGVRQVDEKWTIEYLELEITGRTAAEK